MSCCSAWADRAWARGSRQKPSRSAGISETARPRFHRSASGAAFRAQHRYRAHVVHRLEQIRHDARNRRADGIFFRGRHPGPRSGGGPAVRRHHRSRQPAAEASRPSAGIATCSLAFPASAAVIPCCPNSAWCRWRRPATTSAPFSARRGAMAQACGPDVPPADNPGVALGLAIGVLARSGRDKLTIIASPSIEAFGAWAEQLIAESTGKNGKGIIPVAGEPPGDACGLRSGSAVRITSAMRRTPMPRTSARRMRSNTQASPWCASSSNHRHGVAQEFFRFEIATAVAGAVAWHQSVRPAGRRGEQDHGARDHHGVRKNRRASPAAAGVRGRPRRALHRRRQCSGAAAGGR